MRRRATYLINHSSAAIACLILLLMSACNNIRRLPEGENLYIGAKINIKSKDKVDKGEIKKELTKTPRPKPNEKLLGMRIKLSLYNYYTGDAPKKKFKSMVRRKFAEKPVLESQLNASNTADIMVNQLNTLGYFDASVSYSVTTKKRKTSVEYIVTVTAPYKINSISFPKDSGLIASMIRESEEESLIKPGMQYSLDLLKAERARIDYHLTEPPS